MSTPASSRSRFLIVFGVVCLLVGAGLSLVAIKQLQAGVERRAWPTASATIVRSEVIGVRAYRPNVVYEYRVETLVYRDSSALQPAAFGGRNSKREKAKTVIADYPVGATVVVYYNPQDPGESYLRPGPSWAPFGWLGTGGTLVLGGLVLTLVGIRRRRPSPHPART